MKTAKFNPKRHKKYLQSFRDMEVRTLHEYIKITEKSTKIYLPKEVEKSGIYSFWWTGNYKVFSKAIRKCDYRLKGKITEEKKIAIKFSKKWIKSANTNHGICLYIGKSTSMKKRISSHLKLGTENIWTNTELTDGVKPNTVSQLRVGIERVFGKGSFRNTKMFKNISIKWICIDGYEESIERFYLEDQLISEYFALFNIDIER